MTGAVKTEKFKAEVGQVLNLVINSLYSDKDIFLRELVSNAADAIDKLKFESIAKPDLTPAGWEARIRIIPDKAARTLTIADNGIGMTAKGLSKDLGTVAHSGTREFAEKLAAAQQDKAASLIGRSRTRSR
jgi:molecular chaperone HtpG